MKAGKNEHDDANDCVTMLAEDIEEEMFYKDDDVYPDTASAEEMGIF